MTRRPSSRLTRKWISARFALIIDAIEKNGVPAVQVAYFPGIDLYTHIASNPLHDQVDYFKSVINPSIGQIIEEYRKKGALDHTFVIFVSDHGHTPVLKDEKHALGAKPNGRAAHVLTRLGFRIASTRSGHQG